MVATTRPSEPAGPVAPRFDRLTRWFHWTNAALFGTCMLTGAVLYVGQLSALVGNRQLVRGIHVYAGLAIPVVFLLAAVPHWGRNLRADLARLERWPREGPRKFNRGQQLNAAFVFGAAVVMLGTGVIMRWYAPFPLDWRTGATFVHDWFALFLWLDVTGHILIALQHPRALRAMARGDVS